MFTVKELAEELGVSGTTIKHYVHGQTSRGYFTPPLLNEDEYTYIKGKLIIKESGAKKIRDNILKRKSSRNISEKKFLKTQSVTSTDEE